MMSNLFSIIRKAPFWLFVLLVIVLLVIVVICLLPAQPSHSIHLTDDHMLGGPPVLSLIAMVLMAVSTKASLRFPRNPTGPKGSHNLPQLIPTPLLVNSEMHRRVPLRR